MEDQELPQSDNYRLSNNENGIQEIKKMSGKGTMRVNVIANGKITVFELNGSAAAKDLYAQLPLTRQRHIKL